MCIVSELSIICRIILYLSCGIRSLTLHPRPWSITAVLVLGYLHVSFKAIGNHVVWQIPASSILSGNIGLVRNGEILTKRVFSVPFDILVRFVENCQTLHCCANGKWCKRSEESAVPRSLATSEALLEFERNGETLPLGAW